MSEPGIDRDNRRFYKRATILTVGALVIFAVFFTLDFIMEGIPYKIWIIFSGCAACGLVVFAFHRFRAVLNPAFSVPFMIYVLYVIGSFIAGRFIGYFAIFFCICGIAAMYCNRWKYLQFIIFANIISLSLVFAGVPISRDSGLGFVDSLINWAFSALGSGFLYLVLLFVSELITRSTLAEDSFNTLLATTPDYIVLADIHNRVTYISASLAKFVHIENPLMARGRPLLDLFRSMEAKLKAAEVVDSEGLFEGTWELNLEGQIKYFRIISNRLLGENPGTFICLVDISPVMKARYAAEAAARAKSTFLANTSHEIRTPMNAILGMAELILRQDISPEVYEDARNIKQAGKNLLSIINDILDFSKIESGKLDIIPAKYRFDSLINDVLSIIRIRLAEKRLRFITRIDGTLPSVLTGDEVRIRQVLLNLLNNAVKYTREGEICFNVHAAPPETRTENTMITLVIEVSDTGVGIKPEDMGSIFGEFIQLDSHTNRGIEGTGLGLAISRNLCQLMGGDISVESEYGKGSVFRALIPQEVEDASPFAPVQDAGKKLLIIEDRKKQAEALVYTAEHLGLSCSLALTGEEMLSMLEADQYHFVIASAAFYEQTLKTLETLNSAASLVFLPEFDGDAAPLNGEALSLPVHPLSLARFFNGERYVPVKAGEKDLPVKFIAPQARLLVVDDIPTNLRVAKGLLISFHTKVDTCLSGAEAINLAKQYPYDIIFMDHMMPDMDGIEAAARIRAWEAEQGAPHQGVSIIALTANAISGMREMFLEKGFNDYLTKPIDLTKLYEIMGKWIPAEKQEKWREEPQGTETGERRYLQSSVPLPSIPGLDAAQGIAMTGGTLSGYRQVLSLFHKDAETRLPLLRQTPKEDTLSLFTTQVHALKSASASIGASALSTKAARLEAAGRAGDLALIQKMLPGFVEQLSALTEYIRAAVEPMPTGNGGGSEGPRRAIWPEEALALLKELQESLKSQKLEALDSIMEELNQQNAGPGFQEALGRISDELLMAEFDRAADIVRELINNPGT